MPQPLIILAAVHIEATAIARALHLRRSRQPSTWHAGHITLHAVGIRAVHLPPLPPNTPILLAGLAGALAPALRIGDVLLDSSSHPLPNLASLSSLTLAPIHCSDSLLSTPADKAALHARTGAHAVEMESAPIRAALSPDTPFLHLRAISDAAADPLNPALLHLIDTLGRPRPARLTAALLRQPTLTADLLRLRATTTQALQNLTQLLHPLLQSWPPHPTAPPTSP